MEQMAKNRVRPIEGLAHPYAQKVACILTETGACLFVGYRAIVAICRLGLWSSHGERPSIRA